MLKHFLSVFLGSYRLATLPPLLSIWKNAQMAVLLEDLKELNTDYLDVWHLHGTNSPQAISDELLEAAYR